MCHIKREAWFGGTKLNGVNYSRLIDEYEAIIKNIREIFIDTNKGIVIEDSINNVCDKYREILKEINQAYRCMRSLDITNEFIIQTKNHGNNTMLIRRELKLLVTP